MNLANTINGRRAALTVAEERRFLASASGRCRSSQQAIGFRASGSADQYDSIQRRSRIGFAKRCLLSYQMCRHDRKLQRGRRKRLSSINLFQPLQTLSAQTTCGDTTSLTCEIAHHTLVISQQEQLVHSRQSGSSCPKEGNRTKDWPGRWLRSGNCRSTGGRSSSRKS